MHIERSFPSQERKRHPLFPREENLFEHSGPFDESEVREIAFDSFVFQHILREIKCELEDAGFSEDEVAVVEKSLASFSDEEARKALALPLETRGRIFTNLHERIERGELEMSAVATELLSLGERARSTLGFHLSPRNIEKRKRRDGIWEWRIEGYEMDDRDNKLMAYYSLNYQNLYRKKPGKNLYVVRAMMDEKFGHYRDQSNNWGRATSLAIVDAIDLREAEAHVDVVVSELSQKGLLIPDVKKKAADAIN